MRAVRGRYLSGIAAARLSQTGVAGFVAGFPIPEVIQGINAFTLGMRSVNPKAQVKVVWLNAWFDPPREREAAMALMNEGADVLSFQVASTAVMGAAQERGKMAIAFHSDMRKAGPQAQLLAVTHQWGGYDTARACPAEGRMEKPGHLGRRARRHDPRGQLRSARAQGRAHGSAAAPGRNGPRQAACLPRRCRAHSRQPGPGAFPMPAARCRTPTFCR
jgi:hypothetical protein